MNDIRLFKVKRLLDLTSSKFPEGSVVFCEETRDIYIKSGGESLAYTYSSINISIKDSLLDEFTDILDDIKYDYNNDKEILNILNSKNTDVDTIDLRIDTSKLLNKCINIIKDISPEKPEYIDRLYKIYSGYDKYSS
jgi:hypothetical protein